EKPGLPMHHGDHRVIDLKLGRKKQAGCVKSFATIILGQYDSPLKSMQEEIAWILRLQAGREIIDDDRTIGVDEFTKQATLKARQAVTLGKRINVFGESG